MADADANNARIERSHTEPFIYIIAEPEHKTGRTLQIHEVILPPFLDPKHYVPSLSLQRFRTGKRKGASKADGHTYRDRCCWGPTCLYHVKTRKEWEFDIELNIRVRNESRKEHPDRPEAEDPRTQPRVVHASLWDFYKAIGFDHKLRGYRDKDGKEIKFSITASEPIGQQKKSTTKRQNETRRLK